MNYNVISELIRQGASPSYDANGFVSVQNAQHETYKIWSSPRPPGVDHYYHSYRSNPALNDKKVIVGPSFMERNREIVNGWLSDRADIRFYSEGQLEMMARNIYP